MSIKKQFLRACFSQLVEISPVLASKVLYYKTFRKRLDLKKPQTINEKLMWLKFNEDDSFKARCTDKFLVRDYIEESGYSEVLIDMYKVYERVEEVNFRELPDKFVMKCTHGSGFNIICRNKEKLDQEQTLIQLKKWIKTDFAHVAAETHYSKITPRIIVEKYLEEEDGKLPIDYKIHCFHGNPKYIEVVLNRGTPFTKSIMLNCEWDVLPYNKESVQLNTSIDKPRKLNDMLEISKKLSSVFNYVRVDFYFINDEIYFGELTFTPGGCIENFFINNVDYQIGEWLDLTKV